MEITTDRGYWSITYRLVGIHHRTGKTQYLGTFEDEKEANDAAIEMVEIMKPAVITQRRFVREP